MTIAIMQPYIFPYIGYFQLLNIVDKFIIYDDVNFINRGWINRNNILVNNNASLFTIPLQDASQNKLIRDINVLNDSKWTLKLLKSIELSYKKAPHFKSVYPLLYDVVYDFKGSISNIAFNSILNVAKYIGIETDIIESSSIYNNSNLKGQDRILDICMRERADVYINPIGGVNLYSKDVFESNDIKINFIKTNDLKYNQSSSKFVPSLSIIDVVMYNSIDEITGLLNQYTLV